MTTNKLLASILDGPILRVSHVNRYSSHPVIMRENVAEHSFHVTLNAWLIATELDLQVLPTMLIRALLHDIDESVTGDFIRPFKYANPELKEKLDTMANIFVIEMLKEYPLHTARIALDHWQNAKSDGTAGQVIRVADYLAVVQYAYREIKLGNQTGYTILEETIDYGKRLQGEITNSELQKFLVDCVQWTVQEVENAR